MTSREPRPRGATESDTEHARDPLEGLTAADFAGHTDFASWSAEDKLLWLSHAAAFAMQVAAEKCDSHTAEKKSERDGAD